jgi:hypothetical protein
MNYLLTLLATKPGTHHQSKTVHEWLPQAKLRGEYLACWLSDLGLIGQVLLLHGYNDAKTMHEDRNSLALAEHRYGLDDGLAGVTSLGCTAMPGIDPVKPGKVGPVFEVRNYLMRHGAIAPTIANWTKGLPARVALSKPLMIMYTSDGQGPRWIHIWPYASLAEREDIRGKARDGGIWPPKGGAPGALIAQQSEIFISAPFSPVK